MSDDLIGARAFNWSSIPLDLHFDIYPHSHLLRLPNYGLLHFLQWFHPKYGTHVTGDGQVLFYFWEHSLLSLFVGCTRDA